MCVRKRESESVCEREVQKGVTSLKPREGGKQHSLTRRGQEVKSAVRCSSKCITVIIIIDVVVVVHALALILIANLNYNFAKNFVHFFGSATKMHLRVVVVVCSCSCSCRYLH